MITEDYISFEVAKLLKEKGFNEYCWFFYDNHRSNVKMHEFQSYSNEELASYQYSCCTLQRAIKWLKEDHSLFVSCILNTDANEYKYQAVIYDQLDQIYPREVYHTYLFRNPEEAIEAGIRYCLERFMFR